MASTFFSIEFLDASDAEANRHANSLEDLLQEYEPSLGIKRLKQRDESQDYGAVLQIVLGAASIKLLADGLAAWLRRNSGTSIVLKKEGAVVCNLDSKDAPSVMEHLSKMFPTRSA